MHRLTFNSLAGWLCLPFFVGTIGCNQGPQIVPVSGQILIEGKPLQAGHIRIMPNIEGKGRAAHGEIGPDGRFSVNTRVNGKEVPGTFVGEHAVEVSAFEYKNKKKIWYAPFHYTDYQTSKLIAKVDGPMDNLQINLVWDSDANRARGMIVENIQAE